MNETLVVIIPVYNEASVISQTISRVFSATAGLSAFNTHILIFDSASPDGTAAVVEAMQSTQPSLHLLKEPVKSGLGSAYHQAMTYALQELKADIIFEFDADLSHKPEYIPFMLQELEHCDVVLGSRYIKGGSIPGDWGWQRKCLSVLGNWVARLILSPRYKDFTSGFRATRAASLKKSLPDRFISNQYAYKLELLWRLHQHKARIVEFPIEFIDRHCGESKLPANSIIDALNVLFKLRFLELRRYFKMCAAGLSGMAVQFLVFNICRLYIEPVSASQIAVAVAICNNYILYGRFVFQGSQNYKFLRLMGFVLYSVLMVFLQSYYLAFGIRSLGEGWLIENLMLISGIGLGSVFNYFTYSRLVWPDYNT